MATAVRQLKRHQPSDWYTDAYTKVTNAERQLISASDVRQEAVFLRNESDCQTKWDQYSTDVRLSDRINHMRKWKEVLERKLGQLDQEITDLSEIKEFSENTVGLMNFKADVAIECLTLREGRRDVEIVQDEPENQLHKEVELLEGLKKSLQQKISESFEQLCLLQEVRQQVQTNLQDKNVSIDIDIDQYNLSDRSPGITYKPNAVHTPKGSITCQQWDDFSNYIKSKAEEELQASCRLREQLKHFLCQSANEIEAQKQTTEYAFRKRSHESQRAKDELEYQKKNIEDEMAELENNILGIQEAIRYKNRSTMKSETRLATRAYRPNVELCCDAVHYGLIDETKQLYATTKALEEKLKQAQHALDGLHKSLQRLNDDIVYKTQTLRLDNQCMGIRLKLNPPAKSETETNLYLTGMEKMKNAILA